MFNSTEAVKQEKKNLPGYVGLRGMGKSRKPDPRWKAAK